MFKHRLTYSFRYVNVLMIPRKRRFGKSQQRKHVIEKPRKTKDIIIIRSAKKPGRTSSVQLLPTAGKRFRLYTHSFAYCWLAYKTASETINSASFSHFHRQQVNMSRLNNLVSHYIWNLHFKSFILNYSCFNSIRRLSFWYVCMPLLAGRLKHRNLWTDVKVTIYPIKASRFQVDFLTQHRVTPLGRISLPFQTLTLDRIQPEMATLQLGPLQLSHLYPSQALDRIRP